MTENPRLENHAMLTISDNAYSITANCADWEESSKFSSFYYTQEKELTTEIGEHLSKDSHNF
jgi:hypothetical protein